MLKRFKLICCFVFALILAVGCTQGKSNTNDNSTENIFETTEAVTEITEAITEEKLPSLYEAACEYIDEMTLEEKVGQMFIVTPKSINLEDGGENILEVNESISNNIYNYNIGGIILFSENISDRQQICDLTKQLKESAYTPIFIGVDEEGGMVSRLGSNGAAGVTYFSDMASIGATNDTNEAYNVGNTLGRELYELGFNLDFAPVADIYSNTASPEVGNRSFGSDPELVGSMVAMEVTGLQENNVCATLKHFPGHGEVLSNTHEGFAQINCDLSRLEGFEFIPFKQGIAAGTDFIMVSHLVASNVDSAGVPSSLSKVIVTDILRNQLGYNKIIVTDSCEMGAIVNYYAPSQVSVMAINAGCDIILMPENFQEAYDEVINQVNNGQIDEERINESVIRIIMVKMQRGIIEAEYE